MSASSTVDSRAVKPNSATTKTVQGTANNYVQTSGNPIIVAITDSRKAAPVDSRLAAPQNCRK